MRNKTLPRPRPDLTGRRARRQFRLLTLFVRRPYLAEAAATPTLDPETRDILANQLAMALAPMRPDVDAVLDQGEVHINKVGR